MAEHPDAEGYRYFSQDATDWAAIGVELDRELAEYVNRGCGRWRYGSCPSGERWAMAPGLYVSIGSDEEALRLHVWRFHFTFDWDSRRGSADG